MQGFAPFKSLDAFIRGGAVSTGITGVLLPYQSKIWFLDTPAKIVRWRFWCLFDSFLNFFLCGGNAHNLWSFGKKVGLRESSAALGALVGANFNNDGTALYEVMSALYISQLIGQHLSLEQQLIVIFTSIFASVGVANIPNAGLVTMILVLTSIGLPTQYIALLVTIDWFLDRCRTAINVMLLEV